MVAPSGPGIARHPRKSHADPIRIQKHPVGAVRDAASRFLGCFDIKPGGLRDQARHQTATMRLQTEDCQTAVHEGRSEEHTSELQSLMRISYAVFCLKKKTRTKPPTHTILNTHQLL